MHTYYTYKKTFDENGKIIPKEERITTYRVIFETANDQREIRAFEEELQAIHFVNVLNGGAGIESVTMGALLRVSTPIE